MNEMRRNFLVGLFVLVGLASAGVLIMLFGPEESWLPMRGAYVLDVHFNTASGIRPGTLVTVGGIEVGRVREVGFRDPADVTSGARVTISFSSGYPMRRGTRAETIEPGLGMGRPPIELVAGPPGEPPLESGASIPGSTRKAYEGLVPPTVVATFEKTAAQIGEAAEALKPVLDDLHGVLQPRTPAEVDRPGGPPGNLSSASARLDATLRHFNEVLGDPNVQSQVKLAVNNFQAVSESGVRLAADLEKFAADAREVAAQAKTLAGDAQASLDKLDANVDQVTRDVRTSLEQANGFLRELNGMMTRVNRGEGTVGKLVTDDRFYEALVLTFRRLAETVEEFKLLAKDWQQGKIRVAF